VTSIGSSIDITVNNAILFFICNERHFRVLVSEYGIIRDALIYYVVMRDVALETCDAHVSFPPSSVFGMMISYAVWLSVLGVKCEV
jgi:hypothetical protein